MASPRFEILKLLGEGGMGQVYLAQDLGQDRSVALKFLQGGLSPQAHAFFKEEVGLLTKLNHPNLVQIYDYFEAGLQQAGIPEGPCFSMELAVGRPLEPAPKFNWSLESAVSLIFGVGRGLNYLHTRRIFHRDLKPSNIFWDSETGAKILDFGLAGLQGSSATHAGTLSYLPPEAFLGRYDEQSDLFSLGVCLYEIFTGTLPFSKPLTLIGLKETGPRPLIELRPDLPEYLCDLVHRLLDLNPESRPGSALAVLRYLNQHLATPQPLEEAGAEGLMGKLPWVGRVAEVKEFRLWSEGLRSNKQVGWYILSGPTGVGRSRFLEHSKWPLQLAGAKLWNFAPTGAQPWYAREGGPFSAWTKNILGELNSENFPVLTFTDLHLWDPSQWETLRLFFRRLRSLAGPVLIALEVNSEMENPGLSKILEELRAWQPHLGQKLADLGPEESLNLLSSAVGARKLPEGFLGDLQKKSGGRPLLLVESLRQSLSDLSGQGAAFQIPKSLEEVAQARVRQLSNSAQDLLALLAVPQGGIETGLGLNPLIQQQQDPGAEALELDRAGILSPRTPGNPAYDWAFPSLGSAYRGTLSPETLRRAHETWWEYFLEKVGDEPRAIPEAKSLLIHAWHLGDRKQIWEWGLVAAEFAMTEGANEEAIEWFNRLLDFTRTDFDHVYIYGHLAPIYLRLGRYAESQQSYDQWFHYREDDETLLQLVKYRCFSGSVAHACGEKEQARDLLTQCLQTGDSQAHEPLRYFHGRAHLTLATLEEREHRFPAALAHLEAALGLVAGDSLLLGEVEQRLGTLAHLQFNFSEALNHFSQCLKYYQAAKNSQAQAIAHQAIGLVYQDQGEYSQAEAAMVRALKLVADLGDLLQEARYQIHRGTLARMVGDYGSAQKLLEEGAATLEVLGRSEDRGSAKLERLALYQELGNFHRARGLDQEFTEGLGEIKEQGLDSHWRLLQAERAYWSGDFSKAWTLLGEIYGEWKGEPTGGAAELSYKLFTLMLRTQSWVQGLSKQDPWVAEGLSFLDGIVSKPAWVYHTWATLLCGDPQKFGERELTGLLKEIGSLGSSQLRMEFSILLAREMSRRGLKSLSARLQKSAAIEWKKIYKTLPEELKMDFEKNRPLQDVEKNLDSVLPPLSTSKPSSSPQEPTEAQISQRRFRQLSEINHQIGKKKDLEGILERVMDAAIELTGAERGFLLLKSEADTEGPMAGYEVKTARHLNQGSLKDEDFQFSMSTVRQTVETGSLVLTDNAQVDERFQEKQSVMQFQLKSILAFPLELDGKVLGAIYLDHRYQPGCFGDEEAMLVSAFASQASLAIEKVQMLSELRKAKEQLEGQVEDQAQQLQALSNELAQVRSDLRYEYSEIIGQSPGMMQVFQMLDHVTETTIPVWIWGDSGTGKELVAQSLHFNSPRKSGPFISENCSAIPETLLESELFGHKKGAFTHADRDRVGLFEQASGGTLFLDEIGDMSLAMQAILLRVLQEGEVRPVGANKKIKVDVRLVTASHRDLQAMVQKGDFRQDLFYRVNGMTIRIPPLRERKEDIPLLAEHLIKKVVKQYNLQTSELTDSAYHVLSRYGWPGNIRELEGALRNALLFAKGRPITPEFLSLTPALGGEMPAAGTSGAGASSGEDSRKREEDSEERQIILQALRKHDLKKEAVAQDLGVSLRTLYTRMDKLGIPKKKSILAKYLGQA